jgi:hypothetical protein
MRRAPVPLVAIAVAAAVAAGVGVGCGDDEPDTGSEDVAAFCAEAPDTVDGLATVEVLAPGANPSQLEDARGVIQSELGSVTVPSGTPEADALGPAIDDVLALSAEDLDSPAGAESLKTARERVEAFEAAAC